MSEPSDNGQARGERGRRSARGATWRAAEVPGIVGAAVDVVEAVPVAEHIGHVGLAEYDRAGGANARDHERVLPGYEILERRHAPGGRQAVDVERFLDHDGNALERAMFA